jgi:hypothetical protein
MPQCQGAATRLRFLFRNGKINQLARTRVPTGLFASAAILHRSVNIFLDVTGAT